MCVVHDNNIVQLVHYICVNERIDYEKRDARLIGIFKHAD